MPDLNVLPTEEELKFIEDYDVIKDGPINLIEYLKTLWLWDDYIKFDEKTGMLELHTGGAGPNEVIIQTLEKTFFWYFYWEKSFRGGHYFFEISKRFVEYYEDKK